MKTNNEEQLEKRQGLIAAIINQIPASEDQPSDQIEESESKEIGDEKNKNINKPPIIGGADDVYRENPSDDLRDSDLVDDEPLQDDIDRAKELNVNPDEDALGTRLDSDEDDADISNLDDNEDIIDEEPD